MTKALPGEVVEEGTITSRDILIDWLIDAYNMETAFIPVLESHARSVRAYPHLHARAQQHLKETRRHAELVRACIERLGGYIDARELAGAAHLAPMRGAIGPAYQAELVKSFRALFAAEQFEIATYTALIAAARAVGDRKTARVCQEILDEEEDMARWLAQYQRMVVQERFCQTAAGAAA